MPFFGCSPYPPILLLYSFFEEGEDDFSRQLALVVGAWMAAMLAAGLLAMVVRRIVEPPAAGEPRKL